MKTIRTALLALVLAACSGGTATTTTGTEPEATTGSTEVAVQPVFPVTVTGTNGEVTIDAEPQAIVSLSPTGTEMLFAIGAGSQVTAVDEYSYYPPDAPVTDLSGFQPNVEAIASYDPDLVLVSDDIGGVIGALEGLGIAVLQLSGDVTTLGDVYRQIEILGEATGKPAEAEAVVAEMKDMVDKALALAPDSAAGLSYYHELDPTYYSATSATFIGHLYGLFGLENIADAADADGSSAGYPQLSEEYILEANPDFIFVTDCCGDTAQTVAERAGWGDLTAVRSNSIVVFDDDISSRWGPRIVEFIRGIAQAIEEKNPT